MTYPAGTGFQLSLGTHRHTSLLAQDGAPIAALACVVADAR
jgi:hypothetical protein